LNYIVNLKSPWASKSHAKNMERTKRASMDCLSTWMNACFFSSCDSAPSNQNHFWNKISDYGRMAYIFFLFSFGCSLNHIFLTLFPSNQFLDQLKMHDCNLINKLFVICSGHHHSRLIAKIMHLFLLVNNQQNGSNYINILWPHLFSQPTLH
jgi:hypothetical protein